MPEAALRVRKQFWKPLDRAVRRVRRPRTVELWQPPFRRPFRLRAEHRGTGLEGLRNPLSGIRSPFGGRRWSPTKLFQNGEVGLWFDDSDFSTLFQDSAGTTPVTAVEQAVGLHLDKSKGLAQATVATFDGTSATGWTYSGGAGGGIASSSGKLVLTCATTLSALADRLSHYALSGLTVGRGYKVTAKLQNVSDAVGARLNVSDASGAGDTNGTSVDTSSASLTDVQLIFIATSTTMYLRLIARAGNSNAQIAADDILIVSILGNHRYQSTSAARPVVSARVNLLTKTESGVLADYATRSNASQVAFSGVTSGLGLAFAGGVTGYALKDDTVPIGPTYKIRVLVRMDDNAGPPVFGSATSTNSANDFVLGGGNTDLNPTTYVVESLGGGLYAVSATWSAGANTYNHGILKYNTNSSRSFTTSGWDVRPANDGVNLPAYQRVNTSTDYDTSGFPMYLKYDGTDDFMETAAVDFSGTDAMSVFAGVRKLTGTAGTIAELSATDSGNDGMFSLFSALTASNDYEWRSKGTVRVSANYTDASVAPPISNCLTCLADISSDSALLRVNGTQVASNLTDQGTGNFGNYKLYFGMRAGTSIAFNGREYQTIIRGAASTAAEIANAEAYVNSKTKAY